MHRLIEATGWVLLAFFFAAVAWVLFGVAHHYHRVLLMKLDSGYGFKDAAVLLRRKTRRENGYEPGKHRPDDGQAHVLAVTDGPPDLVPKSITAAAADWATPEGTDGWPHAGASLDPMPGAKTMQLPRYIP